MNNFVCKKIKIWREIIVAILNIPGSWFHKHTDKCVQTTAHIYKRFRYTDFENKYHLEMNIVDFMVYEPLYSKIVLSVPLNGSSLILLQMYFLFNDHLVLVW